ncbi:protein kinase [Sphingomonas sp. RT2P30]|uniref:protein kinase domain-containing protein n=1 Tax=Parasphingomonas halimpatiens TaxID=3096162 RepID=UPI002FC93789
MARQPRSSVRGGDRIGGWRLTRRLGQGGNGEVWRAEQAGRGAAAIKILKRVDAEALARFEAETAALAMAVAVPGIVPLIVQGTLPGRKGAVHWFAMPLAAPFASRIAKRAAVEVVAEFLPLAKTLADLHALEIFHRDIKPANILVLDDRLCFSDFGLVKYPTRPGITPARQDVGPKFTMAPEMRRVAAAAAGGPADVFSFAKTLWIGLTGQPLGFDGQYVSAGNLALSNYMADVFTTPIDELLGECTDNDPAARPTMDVVHARLADWLAMMDDFDERNLGEWTEVQNRLFPVGAPSSATWTDIDSICSLLRLVGQNQSLNHMFFPDGGGMTVTGVTRATEAGLIELHSGFVTVLKPEKLTFESFRAGSQWNYFRLEAAPIEPTGTQRAYLTDNGYAEEIYELSDGRFVSPDAWDNGEYVDDPAARGAKHVRRYRKGAFVIFSTASPYNRTSATYDGRHEKMSEAEFRAYMQANADHAVE